MAISICTQFFVVVEYPEIRNVQRLLLLIHKHGDMCSNCPDKATGGLINLTELFPVFRRNPFFLLAGSSVRVDRYNRVSVCLLAGGAYKKECQMCVVNGATVKSHS